MGHPDQQGRPHAGLFTFPPCLDINKLFRTEQPGTLSPSIFVVWRGWVGKLARPGHQVGLPKRLSLSLSRRGGAVMSFYYTGPTPYALAAQDQVYLAFS